MPPDDWRMSSYSNPSGNCVEWKKSSYSSGGNCVEVAVPAEVWVRDSKNRDGGMLTFSVGSWAAFVTWVKEEQ